ncbi:MAG: caspase family protein [Desulfobacterales bacterium]|jgi:hypothetical protein
MVLFLTLFMIIAMMGPSISPAVGLQSGYSSSHALVVGIDQYDHWPNLEYATRDAAAMAAFLRQKNFQVIVLTNQKATQENIWHQLETLRHKVDANSRFIFFFAGHGQTEDRPGGRERGYILPSDADAYDWEGTMLPMDRLNRKIKSFKAKHILLAFDSCYSGLGLTRAIKRHPQHDSAYIHKMMQTRSIQILTAGSRSEQAVESEGHGLFTDHLLAALNGAADINADGHITATEIYATVRPSITQQSLSRQTPQFGYIEGNGDMIFDHSPADKNRATVLVDTRIDGIDVWAGNQAIGRRLKTGRHRLTAWAGRTAIMVKKGGQTLYLKKAHLQAGRPFAVNIGGTGPVSNLPEPFAVTTIASRKLEDYSNAKAYDLDADGREEFIVASGSGLYALKADESTLWTRNFAFPITVDLVDHWDSGPAIGVSGTDGGNFHLLLLDRYGEDVWHHVRKIEHDHLGQPDGGGRIAGLADIDFDGHKEIITIATADLALKPRGIIVYDRRARELWRYLMGPKPQNLFIWANKAGRPDIIVGTYGSADGHREIRSGTDDRQSFLISIDSDGKTNWARPMGAYYTGVHVIPGSLEHDDHPHIYAFKFASSKLRDDEGGIYKISRSGRILQGFDTENSILSVAASPSPSPHPRYFFATDNQMNLYQFDEQLKLLQKTQLKNASPHQVSRVVGVHDYDGDGENDVLVYAYESLFGSQGPMAAPGGAARVFHSNLDLQIYSQDLSRLLKRVSLFEGWEKMGGFAVVDLHRARARPYPFMVLSNEIIVYNY